MARIAERIRPCGAADHKVRAGGREVRERKKRLWLLKVGPTQRRGGDGGGDVLVVGCDEFASAADNPTRGHGPTGWCREVGRRAG